MSAYSRIKAAFLLALLSVTGCGKDVPVREVVELIPTDNDAMLSVPSASGWVDTGIDIRSGEPFSIVAWGQIDPGKNTTLSRDIRVGPEGTFFYSDRVLKENYPLPAAAGGPAPCFGLIGRIDGGEPFYVGSHLSREAPASGRLYLGVNDFDPSDNHGTFQIRIGFTDAVQPVRFEQEVAPETAALTGGAPPVPNARVVVFYLDGLRPDVIREMTAMGHLPNINSLFVEGGVWLGDTFTGFPSDTITSNGTMWTGCFSDRHGLKGQVRFSRRTLRSESYLEALGPSRSSRVLHPQGYDWALQRAEAEVRNLTAGNGAGDRWEQAQTSGVPPLYQYLRAGGGDWATGALPMMTDVPPILWTRSLIRQMPYFRAQDSWQYIDDANTHYALKFLIPKEEPVTIIWLPETDSVSHKMSRGQFGITRRTIALADRMIGRIVDAVETQGLRDSTYFMLISDHGHHGGRDAYLTHYDLADQLFHRPRQISSRGEWVGGGLGLSVRQHRFWNRHPEDGSKEFVFIDGDSDGTARIFLPVGHFRSGKWFGRNRPGDLLNYRLDAILPPLNLPETIVATEALDGRGLPANPIDLVLMRLDDSSILITTRDRGQAVIDRRLDLNSKWLYRYRVVQNVVPTVDGEVAFDVVPNPVVDPLQLLNVLPHDFATRFDDERTWLRRTAQTRYPDGIVTLTRHMLWQDNLKYREDEYAPDLVVTARENWYFSTHGSPGTMHGYPLPDSMRATWFVSGPNVRRGARLREPSRLADLTPTILYLVGADVDYDQFDGRVIADVLESPSYESQNWPLYWSDVNLNAWRELVYLPARPYEHLPWTMNRPASPWDISNIAYNLISIGDISLLRVFDDVISPLTGDEEYVVGSVEKAEEKAYAVGEPVGEAARVFDLSGLTLSDYSQTSIGNVKRIDRAVDWVQKREQEVDRRIAEPFGAEQTPGSALLNGGIDLTQKAIWGTYQFLQRAVIELLDEDILNGLENGVDRSVNRFRQVPAEEVVP